MTVLLVYLLSGDQDGEAVVRLSPRASTIEVYAGAQLDDSVAKMSITGRVTTGRRR